MEKNAGPTWVAPLAAFGVLFLVLVSLVVKLFLVSEVSGALVAAIAVTSGLLILSPSLSRLTELSISAGGLVAKIREVEQKVQSAERKIEQLFASTMSEVMFENLCKLASGRFGHFKNSGGLRNDLRHLRDLGYIKVSGHISELPPEGPDLSAHATVTDAGMAFVDFRRLWIGKAPVSDAPTTTPE